MTNQITMKELLELLNAAVADMAGMRIKETSDLHEGVRTRCAGILKDHGFEYASWGADPDSWLDNEYWSQGMPATINSKQLAFTNDNFIQDGRVRHGLAGTIDKVVWAATGDTDVTIEAWVASRNYEAAQAQHLRAEEYVAKQASELQKAQEHLDATAQKVDSRKEAVEALIGSGGGDNVEATETDR